MAYSEVATKADIVMPGSYQPGDMIRTLDDGCMLMVRDLGDAWPWYVPGNVYVVTSNFGQIIAETLYAEGAFQGAMAYDARNGKLQIWNGTAFAGVTAPDSSVGQYAWTWEQNTGDPWAGVMLTVPAWADQVLAAWSDITEIRLANETADGDNVAALFGRVTTEHELWVAEANDKANQAIFDITAVDTATHGGSMRLSVTLSDFTGVPPDPRTVGVTMSVYLRRLASAGSDYLPLAGGTMAGPIDMNGYAIDDTELDATTRIFRSKILLAGTVPTELGELGRTADGSGLYIGQETGPGNAGGAGSIVQARMNPIRTHTSVPGANDDSAGNGVNGWKHPRGAFWHVQGTTRLFRCADDTPTAAVWEELADLSDLVGLANASDLTAHEQAPNPHSGSASDSELAAHTGATIAHGTQQAVAGLEDLPTDYATDADLAAHEAATVAHGTQQAVAGLEDLPDVTGLATNADLAAHTGATIAHGTTQDVAGLEDIAGVGGGIPEAPTDGNSYGRENAAWVRVPTQLEHAAHTQAANPHSGSASDADLSAHTTASAAHGSNGDVAGMDDIPAAGIPEPADDGVAKARRRDAGQPAGVWEDVASATGGIPEPTDDGETYGRQRAQGQPTGTWVKVWDGSETGGPSTGPYYVTAQQVETHLGGSLPTGVADALAATGTAAVRAVITEGWWTTEAPAAPVPDEVQMATLNVIADIYRSGTGGGEIQLDYVQTLPAGITQNLVRRQYALLSDWLDMAVVIG